MQRFYQELERDIDMRNWQNENLPVYTRQMTAEEMAAIFGGNPDAIKNISRNSDEKESTTHDLKWSELTKALVD